VDKQKCVGVLVCMACFEKLEEKNHSKVPMDRNLKDHIFQAFKAKMCKSKLNMKKILKFFLGAHERNC
jgi:hypothetical protein